VLVLVVLLALVPVAARADAPAKTAPGASIAETTALIREVTADVEAVRGLRRKTNLKVELLDGPLFIAKVREKAEEELKPAIVAQERARWLAFDLAPPDADPARILLAVLDEQVAGFYDPHEKKLFVRSDAGTAKELLRLVLAHEIEHALQDQNFGIPDLAALPDDDVRIARSALLEGDAMAVMTAYAAKRAGKPLGEAFLAATRAMRKAGTAGAAADAEKLKSAPAVVREELLFPYVEGFAFVVEAWKQGGFPQLDKLFARPPQSTHEVLHPEAYFARDQGVAVAPPPLPKEARLLARGRMGELGTRLALAACLDPAVAAELSPAWAGDAYAIYEVQGRAELIWESAWSAGKAENVANVLPLLAPCWREQRGIAQEVRMGRKGPFVAISRGSADVEGLLAASRAGPAEQRPR
jgi:hypothetical protein